MLSNNNPRILHIASGDLWAGAEVQMYTLVKSLSGLGVKICAVILNEGLLTEKLRLAGINVIVLDETKLNGFRIFVKLIQIIREQRPDIIHTHRIKENILGGVAGLVAGKVPSVRTVHGVLPRPPKFHIPKQIFYFLNRFTGCFIQSRIISVSEKLAEILVKEYPRRKIRVIENGIDIDDIQMMAGKSAGGCQNNRYTIGIVGRLVPVKRIDIVINAAHYLMNKGMEKDFCICIIGDGPFRNELEALSRKNGTDKIIRFLGHQDNILAHIKQLDVIMMTSNYEGLPMVLLESMALRVPIVAHKTGGIPGLLDNGTCGILIGNQDPEAYAQAAIELRDDPELRARIVDNAFNRVASRYSAKMNAQSCLQEYVSLEN